MADDNTPKGFISELQKFLKTKLEPIEKEKKMTK
jgi:hypothetical protein